MGKFWMGRSCLLLLICLVGIRGQSQLQIEKTLCENKTDPWGVNLQGIRFSWELNAKENDQYQTAYEIVVASTPGNSEAGQEDVYHSLKTNSRQSILVEYSGRPLQPGRMYYWRVRVWDRADRPSEWSVTNHFTTGLFGDKDWAGAKWIGYEELPDSMRVAPGVHVPLVKALGTKCLEPPVIPLFRRQFSISKKVRSALLFITGLGQYQLYLNGNRAGDAFLAPGWTYFDKTVLYDTYDVTQQLNRGLNAIGVLVGNGFYNINRERYFKFAVAFGVPRMICRLKILYQDGDVENIVSDESWRTTPSPIMFSSIYGGEDYDAQKEKDGWNKAGIDDSGWKQALPVQTPRGQLLPEQDYPVRLLDSFDVKKVSLSRSGGYVCDFGQNLAGIIRLKVKGKRGQVVKLIPAELLNGDKLANQGATGEPYYLSYTLKGEGEEVWQPAFTYYGFRYVQVEGAVPDTAVNETMLPVITQLTSFHNRNSSPINGTFSCSNDLFNRIDTLIGWAIKSNLQSVVTDCPHREKLSWLEQDYLMGGSIHYNYDIFSLYRKLVFDLRDVQHGDGLIPDIAPEYVDFYGGFLDSPEWGSSAVLLPWLLYSWYGDKSILRDAYSMMKRYLEYLKSKSSNYILSYGLGDWFDYGPRKPGVAQLTPIAVTATAIYYYDVKLLAKMASILRYAKDASVFRQEADAIRKAFNDQFFNASTKVYSTGSQTAMAMPLCIGLVDKQNTSAVLKNLVDSIYANNKALTAGDIGFHFLIKALDEGGASQLIYDMNDRDDVPGYGYQLMKGATALTESWPALENRSNNHLMLGHIMEWFYNGLAGIAQEDSSVAFDHIRIRPQVVGDITWAKGTFHSPFGWIDSEWKKEHSHFSMMLQIPVNTIAAVYLPATNPSKIYVNGILMSGSKVKLIDHSAMLRVGSGSYKIDIEQNERNE